MCSGPYVDAKEQFGAEILAVPVINGKAVYHSYVIVRRESPYRGFGDLRGRAFAFTDPLSNTGGLYPALLAARAGATPESYFSRTFFTGGHDNSIQAVADGLADAAAVDSIIWEALSMAPSGAASRTRVLLRSPPYGSPPVVAHPMLDPGIKKALRAALLGLHEDAEGRVLLQKIGIDRFTAGSDSNYDDIRRMKASLSPGSPRK